MWSRDQISTFYLVSTATNYFVIFEIHLKWRTVSHLQVAFEILKLPVLDQIEKLCAIEALRASREFIYTGFLI